MNVSGSAFTHVMHADDIMLFAKASCSEVQILDKFLVTYCEWFGQKINHNKSGLICSKMDSRLRKREIKLILDIKKVQANVNYLGSPFPLRTFQLLFVGGWMPIFIGFGGIRVKNLVGS